jgi:hypothetical protein
LKDVFEMKTMDARTLNSVLDRLLGVLEASRRAQRQFRAASNAEAAEKERQRQLASLEKAKKRGRRPSIPPRSADDEF